MTSPQGTSPQDSGTVSPSPAAARSPAAAPTGASRTPESTVPGAVGLRQRLVELRGGPEVPQRTMDARAIAALAANPGCRRRALLDGAGVDKGALARTLGAPAPFGQSQFAFMRGHAFEARVKADGGAELVRLLWARTGEAPPEPGEVAVPEVSGGDSASRAARTRTALEEAAAAGGWSLLDHPVLALDIAGSPVHLEPDAIAVHPGGDWSVIEIKSFPMLDGSADAAKVGAAARQAAVYALALDALAASGVPGAVRHEALLVCPRDFSNLPTAASVDLRKQCAATRRQLARLTRVDEIAAALPDGMDFAPSRSAAELTEAVEAVPAAYAPECLASCELAFHCRDRARAAGSVEALGRAVRGELGGLATVADVLAAATATATAANGAWDGGAPVPEDPAVAAVRRAARLRAEALGRAPADGAAGAHAGARAAERSQEATCR